MIHLNDEAIRYGVSMCESRPRYKVYIATTARRRNEVFISLYSAIEGKDCAIRKSNLHMEAIFPNGSYIRTIPATDNSRGYRAHLLIVDDDADQEIIDYVLRPHEILEDIDRHMEKVNTAYRDVSFKDEFNVTYTDNTDEIADVSQDDFLKILCADYNF